MIELSMLGVPSGLVSLPELEWSRPRILAEQIAAWWTTKRTGWMGVAVGDGDRVWLISNGKARVVGRGVFMRKHGFSVMGIVNLEGDVDLDKLPRGPRSGWKPVACWATRGLIESDGCVAVAKDVLNQAGYRVPLHVTTPAALLGHLIRDGTSPRAIALSRSP